MPQSQISIWLDFALQQMVAESYLDDPGGLLTQLTRGNNRFGFDPPTGPLLGATRFTNVLTDRFIGKYDVVSHHANDATRFSATLMRDTTNGEYTLSFRSTEYPNQSQGGDWERDGLPGADGEIFFNGFAFGQLVSMEQYYQQLKADGWLPLGAMLNVTGYSLGGHLATVFTELHANEIQHAYTFNGAGHGEIAGGTPGLPEGARIAEMLEYFSDQLVSLGVGEQPFASGATGNLYTDSRYQTALQAVLSQYQPTSRALSDIPRSDGAFAKITQIVGHAAQGDTEYVANSGHHAAETRVYIEGQPDFDGFGGFFGTNGAYGTTHSITLIVDSLALQELFQTLSPTLQPTQIEAIFTASSSDTATGTTVGLSGSAEAKPLENTLDAVRRLFLTGPITETPSDPATGGFGNLANRNKFYEGLAAVKTALAGGTVTIEPFVELNAQGTAIIRLDPTQVKAAALENTDRGLAFRYALRNLNPFAVIGADYNALDHAANGALTLFDSATGFGDMSDQYLTDRAAFLEAKIELNLLNTKTSGGTIHYQDYATGFEVATGSLLSIDQEFLFGSNGADTLEGNSAADHLFGGAGADVLNGSGGHDYLQGDAGSDRLDGDVGSDTLKGGQGLDLYVLNPDGTDTIEDSDHRGALLLNDQMISGGLRRPGESGTPYTSLDGQFTFVQSGSTLTINGHVTIQNWQPGDLGITLRDLSSLSEGTPPVLTYGPATQFYNGDATDNVPIFQAAGNHDARGFGGNDILDFSSGSALYDHQIFGGDGHDELHGGPGQDRVYGETGRDLMLGGWGNDVLDG